MVGVGLFVVNSSQETVRLVQSDKNVSAALNQVKEALVAYAAANPGRPGALPCPDGDDNGDADPFNIVGGVSVCPTYLGRLPWRTLGIGDVHDGTGQRYWYTLSDKFRDFPVINSDTTGTLEVRTGPTATVLTTEAVAVVFAPGGVVGSQSRDSAPAVCTTTGTMLPRDRCAANYLEDTAGRNNAAFGGAGPFISAESGPTFNDRLVVLRASDVMPLVERRVAGDMRRVLLLYRETARQGIPNGGCNCYPWADTDLTGKSKTGYNHGRIPLSASPHPWSPQKPPPITIKDALNKDWAFPPLPPYFVSNGWDKVIYYAVGANATEGIGTKCVSCTKDPLLPPPLLLKGSLSRDLTIGHAVVLITPGSAGPKRAKGWTGNWGDYIDDGANRDGDDRFLTPASKSMDRDRVFTIADDIYAASCGTNSQMLIASAPCATGGGKVKPICSKAVSNLQLCTQCSGTATEMVGTPCRNTLNPPVCQAAVKSLKGCKG